MIRSLLRHVLDDKRKRLSPELQAYCYCMGWAIGYPGELARLTADDNFVRMLTQVVLLEVQPGQQQGAVPVPSFESELDIQEEAGVRDKLNTDSGNSEVCPQTGIPLAAFERVGRELFRRSQRESQQARVIDNYFKQ